MAGGVQSLFIADVLFGPPSSLIHCWPLATFCNLADNRWRAIRHYVHVCDTGDGNSEWAVLRGIFALKDPRVTAQTYPTNVDDRDPVLSKIAAKELGQGGQKNIFCVPFND